ncbi:bifunctional phosphopantothenoylcysteine decarboxylase/phosphopantothenate--cysteine ligase CoaBC [Candidatus Uabimicrobium sp. HlEnr_7]|uniref:bifunctional phosphopantothenoylcysteine decarboxylase/phosphopantothenate--cysteine ligase CoaBC n=1 Tax=Candidatus Uabimicrobium helgolandensis TaxID=3095367 RepID=UPI0035574848
MNSNIKNKNIVLGVTGSIACYKSVMLASLLVQQGANVDVIMTPSAQKFIQPATFRAITRRDVVTDFFDANSPLGLDHISLAQKDAVIVAPATANTIAKMAHGFSDDPLTCTVLATTGPVIIAPAMETHMYQNFIVQENIQKLKENGFIILGPEKGYLASGDIGVGRMTEPDEILEHLNVVFGENGDFSRLRVLVTAGGTQEKIDAVRFLANRSSGKMGYAVATAARDRGAKVTLITTPTNLEVPKGVDTVFVDTALDMCQEVKSHCAKNDVLVMAAAVADWRAQKSVEHKMKKGKQQVWNLEMIRNPDILTEIINEDLFKVGFAAETEDIIENALQKLISKKLNLIVANDISGENTTFNSDENEVYIITREKGKKLPLMSKKDVANKILDKIKQLLAK